MRNVLGTTNNDKPFTEGEIINFFGESYVVMKNSGRRGVVRPFGETYKIDPFYWEFNGMECRRVIREDEL
jgi:hypothetical protein